MPQTQRKKPSVVELVEQEQARRKPRGPRLSVVELVEQEQRYKQLQPSPAVAPPGFFENLKIGAERAYRKYIDPALASTGEAIEGLIVGDPRRALELAESTARGTIEALRPPQQATPVRDPQTGTIMDLRAPPPRDTRITELQRQREARYQASPGYQQGQQRLAELDVRAALDPSRFGKATRGTSEFLTGAAPTLGVAIATRGALLPTGIAAAVQSAGQPAQVGPNVAAGLLPVPAGKFVAPILRRIRGGRAAVTEAEAAGTAVAREAVPVTTQPANALQSAYRKLGTDNADEVGAMIANANRRYNETITVPGGKKRPITAEERQSYWEDFNRLKALSPEEHRALSQVLPPRTYSPIGIFDEGISSRNISDIPAGQPNAQLDANLRELEQFFGGQRTAAAPATAAIRPVSQSTMRTMPVHSLKPGDVIEYEAGVPARTVRGEVARVQFDPDLETMVPVVKAGNAEIAAVEFLEGGRVVSPTAPRISAETGTPALSADLGVSAATPSARAASASVTGPRAETAALDIGADSALVQPAEKTKFLEALSAFRKAGLLRVTSHAKNIGGTGPWQVFGEAARIPGAILDVVLSPFTKRRTLTGPSFGAVARSGYEAATKGVSEAWQIIRRGITDADIERLGLHREVNTGSKILDTYINGTFRLLAAEDRVFRVYALRRSLEDRARSLALTEIRQGTIPRSQLGQRTRELVKAPPEDMAAAAALDAEVATFNNPNLVSKGLNAARGALEQTQGGRVANFAIDNVVPFAKTPTNVIGAMLEASPLGYGKNAYQIANAIVKKSFTAEQQRAFAQTFGRASAGSGLVALGYVGYRDGWLTGMQEDEPSKRARDTATGRIPGAILVNGSWHSIAGLAPWGSLIVLGATLAREAEQEERKAKEQGRETSKARAIATAAPEAFGRAVLEQPLLSGTKQIIEGLEQPGTFGAKALGGIIGSYIPGHVSDVGQLIDYGVQREAQTLPQRIMQRIPGVRQMLPERQDVLGRPQTAPFPLNPARSQTAQQSTNPLFAELVRHDIGISGFEKKPNETEEELRRRKRDFGMLYLPYGAQLVSSPQYQRAAPEIQQRAIKKLNDRAKDLVEKNRQRFAAGPLSPAALIGAAVGSQAREKAKKNPAGNR